MEQNAENQNRSIERARETHEAAAAHREAFDQGREAAPGLPWVDRTAPTTAKIRAMANEIRKRQGLGPLPETA
jgi:hypothetical protein